MTLLDEIRRREQATKRAEAEKREAGVYVDVNRGYGILVSLALALIHATLGVLARAQYGQDIALREVLRDSVKALPVFLIVVYLCHPFASRLYEALGFASSIACGCYIVYLFNTEGYYASMSKVPAIGTLWIWLFIELHWAYGLATLLLVGLYTYVNGLSLM